VDDAGERPPIRVVDYSPRWRTDFERLNVEWLERWFTVEPVDRELLADPETHVLAGGGLVLFAIDTDDHAVGTVALKHEGGGVYELTKMAVDPDQRGRGVGRLLIEAVLTAFADLGGQELYLESNSRLEAAIALYESVGFRHQPVPRPGSVYSRADVYMVWSAPGD
jgi:putative acetyltransferase